MNIYNNLNKQDKYLLLVRKLKEAFISFTTDILEVFPKDNNLFIQLVIVNQLPDTSLYKILKNNIDSYKIISQDENYLKYNLVLLNGYEKYLNEDKLEQRKIFTFSFNEILEQEYNKIMFYDNLEMIWEWLKIIVVIIKNINSLTI